MRRIVLVNMPFANLGWPNLGISVLKASALRHGLPCDIAYLNYDFAELVGAEDYQWIADCFAFTLGGERLFAEHYFGDRLPSAELYLRRILQRADPEFGEEDHAAYRRLAEFVEPFLDRCLQAVEWSECAVVGFSVTFQQTMASLCLARELKARHPEICVVFGGAACEGEMGQQLLAEFPEIDVVFTGEADLTFPAVATQILSEGRCHHPPPGVLVREQSQSEYPGRDSPAIARATENHRFIVPTPAPLPPDGGRDDSRTISLSVGTASPRAAQIEDLDALPFPDFDDYFSRRRASRLSAEVEPQLFFEMSRGCWWGQKHHCGFCGLNGDSMRYRSKSPDRVLQELRYLWDRYHVALASAADNILDHRYFDSLLPRLAEADLPIRFACELKTNLTRRRVALLLAAGVRAPQLGIETFIDTVLKKIDKGAGAIQNLQTLKWFSEARVDAEWNILYGLPGETADDYLRMADLIDKIVHFSPPLAVGRARMDRFSPFFERPEAFQMTGKRPAAAFSYVYPLSQESLSRLAYYFDFDFADGWTPEEHVGPLLSAVQRWRRDHASASLSMRKMPDGTLILTDTRPCADRFQRRLSGWQAAAYQFCDSGRSLRAILEFLVREFSPPPSREACETWLRECRDEGLMAESQGVFLSLAVWAPDQSDLAAIVLRDRNILPTVPT
ncbi:RiPP maturation radical SAM C-methyltransferase [Thermopirellula anaerolimosa]